MMNWIVIAILTFVPSLIIAKTDVKAESDWLEKIVKEHNLLLPQELGD